MIVRMKDIEAVETPAPRGGRGVAIGFAYEAMKQFGGQIKMFNVMTLAPDSAVGYHQHTTDMEVYLMLDGTAVVRDNGDDDMVGPGDMLITKKGEFHSIENRSEEAVTFVAVIIE